MINAKIIILIFRLLPFKIIYEHNDQNVPVVSELKDLYFQKT